MRLAIITGGSKGLGAALSSQLSGIGFQVLEFSRTAPHKFSVQVDLSLPEESRNRVANAVAAFDAMTLSELVVINNAGTLEPIGPSSKKAGSALLGNINTNFTSAILSLSEIIAKFQAAPCRKIVANISSGAALKGYAGWSLYCAAKAGMEGFFRALAIEQQAEIHPFIPISIDPGVIDTEMQALIRTATVEDFPDLDRFIRRKETGGLASPSKVASAVLRILDSRSLSYGGRYDASNTDG
jgi:benzil reductase ((S)-benzoin forming)